MIDITAVIVPSGVVLSEGAGLADFVASVAPNSTEIRVVQLGETPDPHAIARDVKAQGATVCIAVSEPSGAWPCGLMHIAQTLEIPVWYFRPGTPAHGCHLDQNGAHGPTQKTMRAAEALEQAFAANTGNIAIESASGSLTYSDLDAETRRLAGYLKACDLGANDTVALHFPRGVARIIAVLAAVRAGVAWLPLDPAYPLDRRAFMVNDTVPALILHDRSCTDELPLICPHICFQDRPWAKNAPDLSMASVRETDAAYIIYTSGTTGKPKGAVLPQRGLANLIAATQQVYEITPTARVLQFAPFGFDAFVFEVMMALSNGATLVVPPAETVLAGTALFDVLTGKKITHATLPQALLQGLSPPEGLAAFTCLILAGEAPATEVLAAWAAPGRRIFNAYGPTEATVWASTYLCRDTQYTPPIGSPICNTSIHVLDSGLQPCGPCQAGEIYISGAGVANAYLGRAALTKEKFPANPFKLGTHLYATGDRGQFGANGMLEFLGRADFQVKVRGHRVELPEVEQALQQAGALEAVVLARGEGLIGFVTGETSAKALRRSLAKTMPDFMIPGQIQHIARFARTENGKIDRTKLGLETLPKNIAGPQGEIEGKIANCWAGLLDIDPRNIDRNANFFEIGGHSLAAARYQIRHREMFGQVCTSSMFFKSPTIVGLARNVKEGVVEMTTEALVGNGETPAPFPLSEQQRAIWLLEKMAPGSLAYNAQAVFRFRGMLDPDILRAALNEVVARHEVFRTAFIEDADGEVWQHVQPKAEAQMEVFDLRAHGEDALTALVDEEVNKPFKIHRLPLVRWLLVTLAEGDYALVNIEHHLVHDGWSANLSLRELLDIYDHLRGHTAAMPPPPPAQFHDYVSWTQTPRAAQRMDAGLAYWRAKLAGAQFSPPMLTDFPRPKLQDFAGGQTRFAMPPRLLSRFEALCRAHGVTLYIGMMAALSLLVARLSGREDVLIGTTSANRRSRASEHMLGMFVNTLVIRNTPTPDLSFSDLLEQTQTVLSEAFEYDDLPFELLVRALQPERSAAHNPIFQVAMSYHSSDMPPLSRPDFEVDVLAAYSNKSSKFDWEIVLMPHAAKGQEDQLTLVWTYAKSLYKPETIASYWDSLKTLITACVDTPQKPVSALPHLDPAAKNTLLEGWNEVTEGEVFCLHRKFETMAASFSLDTAVTDGHRKISYDALNKQANRLARLLRAQGVGPEKLVAVLMNRSVDMIVAMLAILKAGGAYLPLDRVHPPERLRLILDDAAPVVLLRHEFASAPLRALDQSVPHMQVVNFEHAMALPDIDDSNLENTSTPENLAYVIFTSGSTGKPKGVMIEHRNAARLFSLTGAQFGFSARDVWSWFHSFAFDFSVWEIWGALLFGGRVVVVPQEMMRLPDEFYQLICEEGVTVLNQTPGAFYGLIRAQTNQRHKLRQVIFGGDMLEVSLLKPWFDTSANGSVVLSNMYGITETTVHVTRIDLSPEIFTTPKLGSPVGRKLDDLRLYILGADMAPVPVGAAGEIYVGGAGVARGYLNRPDLTRERFLPSPFKAGDRLYRTGDLARFDLNGDIEFLGRTDYQISLRGYRIEPGEIESQLVELGAREAVVLVRKDTLVAYVTGRLDTGQLRAGLQAVLPTYMVPVAYIVLETLPLTANGKVDRNALPDPDSNAFEDRTFEAPHSPLEATIIEVWESQLKVSPIGRKDNFFERGGHSLMVIRVLNQLRQCGISIDAAAFFHNPVPAELARIASAKASDMAAPTEGAARGVSPEELALLGRSTPGPEGNLQDAYPLTPFQEAVLFHYLIETGRDPYIVYIAVEWETRNQLDAFVAANADVVARHDTLRTGIVWEGLARPLQYVAKTVELPVEHLTLRKDGPPPLAQIFAQIKLDSFRFDLGAAPLMKIFVAQTPEGRWIAVRVFHHIIDDNMSLKQMDHEIAQILAGRADKLPAPMPFKPFVLEMLKGGDTPKARAYFKKSLSGITAPTLLLDLTVDSHKNNEDVEREAMIDPALEAKARLAARKTHTSLATLCHAAFAIMLHQESGQDKVVFGTVLSGRMLGGEGVEQVIGPMINTLPMTSCCDGRSVRAFVQSIATDLLKLIEFEHTSLTVAQDVSQIRPPAPLFGVLFNYRNKTTLADHDLQMDNAVGGRSLGGHERNNFPLTLSVDESEDKIEIKAMVAGFDRADQVLALFQSALEQLSAQLLDAPDMVVSALDSMPQPAPSDPMVTAAPEAAKPARTSVPPEGEIEKTLAEIWCEVLGLDRIGRHDNFFAFGGSSLSALRVMGVISDLLDDRVPLRTLFDHPTISELARTLEKDYLSDDI